MEQVLMKAKGVNGQLELLETKIIIRRKGFMAASTHGWKGDKEILLKHISAIQFKKASWIASGFIQFTFRGGHDAKGGLYEAGSDENTILFWPNHQQSFIQIKDAIEQRMSLIEKGASKEGGRYCIECGRSIPFDANLCPYCGHKYTPHVQDPSPLPTSDIQQYPCTNCKRPLRYVYEYGRWYCDNCQQYV